MYVYAKDDIVSANIMENKYWGGNTADLMKRHLDHYASRHGLKPNDIYMIDVGANVGWYTLFVANLGYRVISIEPMITNEVVLRSTLCRNPEMGKKVTFFNKGLGESAQKCMILSGKNNRGDGMTKCGDEIDIGTDYEIRGNIDVVPIDDLLATFQFKERIALVKIDTEGYEPFVLRGGRKILLEGHIPLQMVEFFHEVKQEVFDMYKENHYRVYRQFERKEEIVEDVEEPGTIYDTFIYKSRATQHHRQ